MSFLVAVKTELIKTKRSAAFWMSLLGSAFLPLIFFLTYVLRPDKNYARMQARPWDLHFVQGWQAFAAFLLPMFVILICSLIPQIEFKNNTWKQVFASPQSIGNIFFSKYVAIALMILFLFLMFNVFMILAGVVPSLFFPKYTFLKHPIDWSGLLRLNVKTYIALLGIISIQYWMGLRFRNFIVPIGIGLALLVTAMILVPWEHIDKMPYAFPLLTFTSNAGKMHSDGPLLQAHELNSIGYFIFFTALAFADMRFRKQRG